MVMQAKVEGAAAKIEALKRFDKDAWKAIQKGTKEATDAITQDAKRRVPPMGLIPRRAGSGWGRWIFSRDGRDLSYSKGDFKFKTRFRSRVKDGFREVQGRAELDTRKPAVAIFTLAGSVPGPNPKTDHQRSSINFKNNINKQQGGRAGVRDAGMWPRLLTPAYHAKAPQAAKTIGQLIEAAVRDVNRA